jgi:hypothetical protein
MVLGFELFGQEVPGIGMSAVVLILMVGVFLVSRSSGGGGDLRHATSGQMHRCRRCGRDFQTEQVELLASGDVKRWIDDRCPNCGWDLEWGSPNKPGGSSGTW